MESPKGFAPLLIIVIIAALAAGIGIGYVAPRYKMVKEEKTTGEKVSPTVLPTQPKSSRTQTETMEKKSESKESGQLTQVEATTLANSVLGSCGCSSRSVSVSQQSGTWYVTVTDNGLQDDSIKAYKTVAPVSYQNGSWTMGTQTRTQACYPGRGHQDFSSAYCE